MGDTYTRQSSSEIVDGEVINASDFNNEFNQLVSAFASSTGHTHDGTTAEGGPITKLHGTAITIGDGTTGTDIAVTFDGETNDGVITWMEDEDHFKFSDDVVIDSTKRLYFFDEGGEYIHGDGTDLNLVASADINIPANIGLTFGDDGEKIEGDGTDLTISGNNINLTAVADVNIPSGVGLTFATAEKIESDGTDLTITVGSGGDINIPADIGLTFGNDGEKIEGDGTDLTISGNNINLTATADVVLAANTGLVLDGSGDEKIESDGTDISISVGSGGDINIPANIGLTFGNDGEKIEGDGTDLTISGNNINLTAVADIVVPADVGITFGTGEKIEGDNTDLTITSGAKINLTATSDIHVPNNVGIVFGGDSEKIEGDGTDMTISANNLTVDAVADITLDAGDADIVLKDDGTQYGAFTNSSGNLIIKSGSTTMLTGSGANATFAGNVTVDGNLDVTGTFDLSDSNFTNAGDIQLDSITGDGDTDTSITFSGSNVITIAAGGENQVTFTDGAIVPSTDNNIDLGTSSVEFKDAFFDGTVTTDALVADTANIDGGSIDGATLGTNSAITQAVIDNVNIDGATIGHTSDTDLITLSSGVVTVAGELDATSLDISGDADIDGTLEADAITVNGTALSTVIEGTTVTNATNSAHVLVTDNESTDEDNLITFVENATSSTGNVGLEMDGNLTYNPSTGKLTATQLAGTLQTAAQTNVTSLGTLTGLTVSGKPVFDAGISVKNGSTGGGFIEFFEDSDDGTNKVTLVSPALTGDTTLTLPSATGTVATVDDATALAIALG